MQPITIQIKRLQDIDPPAYGSEGSSGLDSRAAVEAEVVLGPGEIKLYNSGGHKRNFVDCVISRKETICPAEVGHRSISVGLLGELAMLAGRKIKWDPDKEEIPGDPAASALLGRSYREPWQL